ncbi:MAG: hypothetical protein JWP66_256 [Naasia sp.]|nr:hypothetical protein [Naasia sp.]
MRPTVTAIVVTHDAGVYLDRTLEALSAQTRLPDSVVLVDIGDRERITEAMSAPVPFTQLSASPQLGFGAAVQVAVRSIAPASGDGSWLWLLTADSAPQPGALAALLHALEVSPSVAVAGPKLMQWADPEYISSFGESMTPHGHAVELAEPLLDQAQYDKESDVLAVAASGMLVRQRLWEQLDGFDPGLPAIDDALDFCVRTRLAGHRVSVVPDARILSAGRRAPGTGRIGPRTSRGARERLARTAQLHRRLVYAPPAAVPLHWLSLVPLAILRALGQLLRKRPGNVWAELAAAFAVAFGHVGSVAAARRRLRRTRALPWSSIATLRVPWAEIRRRRALAREDGVAVRRAGRPALQFFPGGGAATVAVTAVVGLAVHAPLFGAGSVAAPGLLPLGDLGQLWGAVGYGWRELGTGFVGVADPFAWLLALLGTVTFWSPSESIVLLYLLALPLAALGGWFAAARVAARPWLRIVGAVLWTLAPTFLIALETGRLGAVLAHLLLPWLVYAATAARRSWSAAATAALLAAGVLAAAPSLWPALAGIWIVSTAVLASSGRRGRGWHRLLPLPIPALALFLPLAAQHVVRGTPLGVFADPGVQLPTGTGGVLDGQIGTVFAFLAGIPDTSATAWSSLAGSGIPAGVAVSLAVALAAPLVVLALASAFLPGASRAVAMLALAGTGFGTAVIGSRLTVATSGEMILGAWPGAGLSLAWLGLGGAALLGLGAGAIQIRMVRATAGVVVAVAVAAAAAPLLWAGLSGSGSAVPGSERTLPALVAASSTSDPGLGTLVLDAQTGPGLAASLQRGAGVRLDQQSTLYSAASADRAIGGITELAANLASRSGYDPLSTIEQQRIGFVLLQPAAPGTRGMHDRAAAALDGNPLFTPVTETDAGRLWRYTGLDAGLPFAAPTGPDALGTPLGAGMLGVQLLVLILTLLLALPTGGIADMVRPEREVRRGSGLRAAEPSARRAPLVLSGGTHAQ